MLNRAFPRAPLFGACGLIVMAIGLAAWGRIAGPASVAPPPAQQVAARELRFDDRADGGIVVTDAGNEALVEVVAPGTNGFLRSLMRGLARERLEAAPGGKTSITPPRTANSPRSETVEALMVAVDGEVSFEILQIDGRADGRRVTARRQGRARRHTLHQGFGGGDQESRLPSSDRLAPVG